MNHISNSFIPSAIPSAKPPLRKKIKTPGRWDAVMNIIEKSKTSTELKTANKTAINGQMNATVKRNLSNGSIPKISPLEELSIEELSMAIDNYSNNLSPSTTPSVKSGSTSTTHKKNTHNPNEFKVNIPKSKTFIRYPNANQSGGSRSQQPVPAPQTSRAVTPVTSQSAHHLLEKSKSHSIRRDKGVVPPTNDKKTSNRRPIQTNAGSSLAQKRMTNTKVNTSSVNPSKRGDIRSNQANDDKQQIQKLSQLCESKTKQLKTLGLDNNYMRLAFDSLTVVIHHLIEQFEPFENPKIKEALRKANIRCEQLKDNLDSKDVELNNMKLIFEEEINQLMKEREKNYSDLNLAKVTHESNIKRLKDFHLHEVKRLEDKHNKELQISHQNCNKLLNEIEVKTSELNEMKQSRDALEVKAKQLEDSILNDKDKKFKYLSEKSKQLELEVESLKVVMDMKNEKIHTLERKMIETQEKINELPFAKETIRSLQQQIETLQITLDRKIHQYNHLTREHEELKTEFEREMREKRRLSMKNEELAFHLSESFNETLVSGLNNCPNFDPFDPNPNRFKTPNLVRTLNNDETPIKPNRSISMNAGPIGGSTPHAFSRKSHSKVNRSVSMANTTSNGNARNSSYICFTPSVSQNDNLSNRVSDEVFDSGTGFGGDCHVIRESTKKSIKVKHIERLNETPSQSILDSGFEEIQGLNSLSK